MLLFSIFFLHRIYFQNFKEFPKDMWFRAGLRTCLEIPVGKNSGTKSLCQAGIRAGVKRKPRTYPVQNMRGGARKKLSALFTEKKIGKKMLLKKKNWKRCHTECETCLKIFVDTCRKCGHFSRFFYQKMTLYQTDMRLSISKSCHIKIISPFQRKSCFN